MAWPNDVTKKDLRIECCRGSGKGGQNRNKRDTAVRITHVPTGLSARAEDQRTQALNKKNAFLRLAKQLVPLMKHEIKEARRSPKRATEVVRTYSAVHGEVRDKRLSGRSFDYDDVLDGKLDGIIIAVASEENMGS